MSDKNLKAFLALVQAGLWEMNVGLLCSDEVDFPLICKLAREQAVIGLLAAGIEHMSDVKIPQVLVLQIVGEALQVEQRNKVMNSFIEDIVKKMRKAGVYSLLVKGQGVAQCYKRPLWRPSGDIDFLLDDTNYKKAIELLLPLSSTSKSGGTYSKEFAVTINQWVIELHGSLRTCLSTKLDKEIDKVQGCTISNKRDRVWKNGETDVLLPSPDEDVFFVFTHFIKHFYKEGMILRQICDWCRLLWTYNESLNYGLLESRIRRAGLLNEWKTFAALAVEHLGMPVAAMPMYDSQFKAKGTQLMEHILRDEPYNVVCNTVAIAKIFPMNTMKFLLGILFNVCGLKIKKRIID